MEIKRRSSIMNTQGQQPAEATQHFDQPAFKVTIVDLVQHLMSLPADLLVLNTSALLFLAPPPKEESAIIKPAEGIILP
jgi:hypothetical protein